MSGKSDIWMPIYIGDLLADTQHLTNEQFGIYHKVFYHQWRHGHFSDDDLFSIAGFSSASFEGASSTFKAELKQGVSRALEAIKKLLSVDSAGLLFSRRCDIEKEKWTHKKEVYVERARKGGMAKAKRRREEKAASSSASSVLESVLESCTSPSPIEEQKQPPPTPSAPRRGIGVVTVPASSTPYAAALPPKSKAKAKPPKSAGVGPRGVANGAMPHPGPKDRVAVVKTASNGHAKNAHHPPNGDLRQAGFEREILEFWERQNPEHPKYLFSDPDRRALRDLLKRHPALSLPELRRMLRNRAQSEINPAAPPHKWLRDVIGFSAGPLGKYGKPLRAARVL